MIKDIDNPKEEFEQLTPRFKMLYERFLAIAMDYKHYINADLSDNEIYNLRDNVLSRLYSARFHFQLLIEYHYRVEHRLKEYYSKDPKGFFNQSRELFSIQEQSTKEIYSLFDSMIYHLCSIFDYLFRLINYSHGKTILKNPKWNLFKSDKNKSQYIYCSKEIIDPLEKLDNSFIYPLIKHRSHLIHTENDMGEFQLNFNLSGDSFNVKFHATKLFKSNFPNIIPPKGDVDMTIKYAALWLIDQTIKNSTEVLFELREDMKRNKKIPHGMFVLLGPNNTIEPASTPYWGDRNIN